ncbi:UNVERIFIED_CONTAM: hypothetical protein NCL1_22241 [Trichonephila clavipes]
MHLAEGHLGYHSRVTFVSDEPLGVGTKTESPRCRSWLLSIRNCWRCEIGQSTWFKEGDEKGNIVR